ncbi:hydrolase [Spirochaetia bacterium]|nr:hydrolase [Spirochaetia bacterium]
MYDALINFVRGAVAPLSPEPPPTLPADMEALVYSRERTIPGIRAVLFDIYGTLLTSAAGEIGVSGHMQGSPDALALELGGKFTGEELKQYFRSAVTRLHEERYPTTPYPEIRVEAIWEEFLRRETGTAGIGPEELALRYELAVNPAFPMPGALETIKTLKAAGFTLGIISNAQFFTPILLDAFFGAPPEGLGFELGLSVYSYEVGEAKPSPALFARALSGLSALNIPPASCLFVGNDMLNDIFPATAAGFKTLLFAGDGRSLRLREGNQLVGDLKPTGIIRNLADLPNLVTGGNNAL